MASLMIATIFGAISTSATFIEKDNTDNITSNSIEDGHATVTGYVYDQNGNPIIINDDSSYIRIWVFDSHNGGHIQDYGSDDVDETGYYEMTVDNKYLPVRAHVYAEFVYHHLISFKPIRPKDGYYEIDEMQPGETYNLDPFYIWLPKTRNVPFNNFLVRLMERFPIIGILLNR